MNYDELLNKIKRIHFIGIGGSGMCPLAEILRSEGFELSGSDMNEGETLDRIKSYGIPVFMGHAAENIQGAELVVYSAAIKETNCLFGGYQGDQPREKSRNGAGYPLHRAQRNARRCDKTLQEKHRRFGYTRKDDYHRDAFAAADRQRL